MTVVYLAAVATILAVACGFDLCTREIPDALPVGLGIMGLIAGIAGWAGMQVWMSLLGLAIGFGIGIALFRFVSFGGGDAKLIAALGAALGPVALMLVLFWMALSGGLLALVAAARGHADYAYAPAILGGFVGYWLTVRWLT